MLGTWRSAGLQCLLAPSAYPLVWIELTNRTWRSRETALFECDGRQVAAGTGPWMRCMTSPSPDVRCGCSRSSSLESKPKGRTHWSTRKMAERAGVSASTVGRIWRTFGLQPRRGILQDLRRPAVHREGAGHCRPLPSTRPRRCLVIRRKVRFKSDPRCMGRPERQTHNYIRWHGGPLRGAQRRDRPGRGANQEAASVEGFRELSARSTSGWTPPSPST